MSPTRTGPFTLRMMDRFWSSRKSIRTWVMPPRLPVRPRIMATLPSLTGCSIATRGVRTEQFSRMLARG